MRIHTIFGALAIGVALTTSASAIDVSPDVSIVLDASTVEDEDVVKLDGSVTPVNLGNLPFPADVNAYWAGDGFVLFSLDTTAVLSGGLQVDPRDVVRFESGSYSLEFIGSTNGIAPGVVCNAVARDHTGKLLLSFDTTVNLPNDLIANDEDLVRFDGPGSYSLFFDGTASGIVSQLDLDGADLDLAGNLVVSFDGSGNVDGIDFDDEDALEFNRSTVNWSLSFDASSTSPSDDWNGTDVDAIAVPEPGLALLLVSGIASVLVVAGRRIVG